jgi:hypothetical protein
MYSKVDRVKTYNTTMRQGPASNFIEIEMKKLEDKYKFHSRMFTLVHCSEYINVDNAWAWIFLDIEKIKNIIQDDKNTLFAVLTVETHMGKKKKTTDYEKDKPKPKEDKYSGLEGYPHLHLVVYRTSEGKLENFNELHSKLREQTSFGKSSGDINISGEEEYKPKQKSRLKTSNIGLLSYVLKNTRHEESYKKLREAYEKYKERFSKYKDITLDCSLLIDNSNDKEIIDFFKILNEKKVIVHIPEEKQIVEVKEKKPKAIHGKNGTRTITAAQEDLINASVYVLNNMEKMGMKLCNNEIYIRKENTRRTWKKWGSVEKSIRKLMTLDEPVMYCLLTKNIDILVKNATGEGQTVFPEVGINWFFIEFEDFFLHIPSCMIHKEIPEYIACGLHIPGITLDKFLQEDMTPYFWLSIIRNQKFSEDPIVLEKFKTVYFSVLLPLIQKATVLCLQGIANTGKSTLLEPLRRIFPQEVQTEITKGQFSYSGLPNKRLVVLDDVKPEIYNSGNIKQLLEGGFKPITMESKNVNAIMDVFGGNICISANMDGLPESWYEFSKELNDFVLKTEFQVRLALYRFESKIKDAKPGFLQQIQDEEIGKVFIECGKSYARIMLGRNIGEEIIIKTFEEGKIMRENAERIYLPYR